MTNSKGKIIVFDEKENEVKSININIQNERTINNTLILATKENNLSMVKLALDLGANVNYKNDMAIIEAVKNGNVKIAKLLLQKGANPNAKFRDWGENKTCFELAFELEDVDMLKLLLKYNAKMQYQNKNPLVVIVDGYLIDHELVNLFVEHGADINEAFKRFVDIANKNDILDYFIEKGVDVTFDDNKPLITYIKYTSRIMTEKIIAAGGDVNARDGAPLEEAILRNSIGIVKLLVENGAIVQNKHLILAIKYKREEIVDYFISQKLELDYDKALVEACKCGVNNIIDKLIAAGANAGACDNEAIMYVLSKDSVMLKKLINAGADANLSKIDFNKLTQ